ncbi:MAG TPA: nucleotidyltransferase domain-containing protein [Thermoanaerobaculia bacterium]
MTLSSAMGAGRAASAAIFSGEHSSDRAALAPAISEVRLTDEQIPVSLCLAGGHSSVKTEPIAPAPPWAEITQRLVAELEPDRIILFGSHAWGDPDEDSDLDLLVIVPHSEQPPTQRAVRGTAACEIFPSLSTCW